MRAVQIRPIGSITNPPALLLPRQGRVAALTMALPPAIEPL